MIGRPGTRAGVAATLVAGLVALVPAAVAAEDVSPETHDGPAADAPVTWRQVGRDAKYVFGRPAHLDGRGWTRLGVSIGIGAGLYAVRDEVRDFARDHDAQTPEGVLDGARLMGRTAAPLLVAGGFFIAGMARDSARAKETGSVVLETLTFASAITGVSQRILATQRPRKGDDIVWFGSGGGHSVSGDVTVAASLLAPIIDRYLLVGENDGGGARAWKRTGAWAMYSTVGLVALQRIHADAHYLPDVYFGYLNGLMVGKMIVDSRKGGREWRDTRRAHRVEVSLSPAGVTIAWPSRPAPVDEAPGRR